MKIKVFQIDPELDRHSTLFRSYECAVKNAGKIDPEIYKTVFDGHVDAQDLEDVFSALNSSQPVGYNGHSLSVSDIVEIEGSGCFYCDCIGFRELTDFDASKVAPVVGYRMLVIEPHKEPYGATITTVKGMILTLVLLYASLMDLKNRQCPNFIPAMILILAFVGFEIEDLASMLAGAAAVFIPQLATNMLAPNRAIGGADIKISTALAFLMGAEKGIFALVIGLLLAVIVTAIRNGLEKRDQKASFALVPYLWIGATIAYLI